MAEKTKQNLPYGLWPSPVSAGLISQRIRFEDVRFAGDGQTLVWGESRSGINTLIAQSVDGARRALTDEQSPRGGVGYGGGSFTTSATSDLVVFANKDGRLYRRGLGFEKPRPITPTIASPKGSVAAPTISADERWVAYVYSDGSTDLLALVDTEGRDWPVKLAQGADFYMQPAWHPNGHTLVWVEWDHPNMPWDGTRLQMGRLEGTPPRLVDVQLLAGSPTIPTQQPMFSPDGRWLCFIEETGEWPDLVLYDLTIQERRVLIQGDGFDISSAAWVQGVRTLGWSPSSQKVYYLRQEGPKISLWVVDINTGQSSPIETGPFTSLSQLAVSPKTDSLAFLASATHKPDVIVRWNEQGLKAETYSLAATYDPATLPQAKAITWSSDGVQVHGIYYPPTNPKYQGQGLPPAIVHIHGGPTSDQTLRFNADAAYFTSRGYAFVEVNYRGSTGYGRTYRQAMRQRWGDVDVIDAATCAKALGDQGLADPKRLAIMGGSAGGYTVLNTLIRYPGTYKAGVCLYGVTNLFALNMETHKFEAHYNDSMVGVLPKAAERFQAWSPAFHADQIRDSLYIFQGNEDPVVPPSQAEAIVAALRANGVPHKYKLYEGEGHGFRKSETITDYLKETERFLQEYVLFAP